MTARAARAFGVLHLIAAVAGLAIVCVSRVSAGRTLPAPSTRTFQMDDWNLAWQSFLSAGAINDAYELARRAVKARPDSRRWLARLAQAARWSSHPRTALEAMSRLALKLHRSRYLQPALDLSVDLGENAHAVTLLREMLRLRLATPAQRRMLVDLYLDIGELHQALAELQREFSRRPDRELLWKQVAIYRLIADPDHERAVLQRYRKHFGPTPRVMLAIATLDYVQGKMKSALSSLLAAEALAKPSDTAYWKTLDDLAWLLGDYRLSERASTVLFNNDNVNHSTYRRLIYIEQVRNPERAFAVAVRGWKRTHDPALFLSLLDIASSQTPVKPWLQRAFALLGPEQARLFTDNPVYWSNLATLLSAQGRGHEARIAYRRALRLSPDDDTLLAGYLWLLLDTNDAASVKPILVHIAQRAQDAPVLWSPLAGLYTATDQPQRALSWLQKQWTTHKGDPLWLMNYADTLDQADRPISAWQLRRRAYDILAGQTGAPGGTKATAQRLRALAQLAAILTPGDPALLRIEQLARRPDSAESRVLVLAWMLDRKAWPLARWWRLQAFLRHPPPAWAQLSQALAEDDGSAISNLLERQRASLPRRDRVDAAGRLGWQPLALSMAWQGMQDDPDDARLQRQFADLAIRRSDSLEVAPTLSEAGGLFAAGAEVDVRHWIDPGDRLGLRLDSAYQRSTDDTQLGIPPMLRRSLRLNWRHLATDEHFDIDVGVGRNLDTWFRLGIDWQRDWSARFKTTLSAAYGARPNDTIPLAIAGLEDRVRAGATYQFTPRDSLLLQLGAGRLRAQGGGTLGYVQRFALEADHKLWFAPPDFTLSVSVSGAHYSRASTLPIQLDALVPSGQAPAVSFFVPESFVQACAGGNFNMQYEASYTRRPRPYASANLCANSVSGIGYDLTAGVAVPILGPDHLSLSLHLDDNVGTRTGRSTEVILRYRYHFTL